MTLPLRRDSAMDRRRPASLDRGDVKRRRLVVGDPPDRVALPYYLRMPSTVASPVGTLVAVHGISRTPKQHLEALSRLADEIGLCLVAPLFRSREFGGYQRLRCDNGRRADLVLLRLLDELQEEPGLVSPVHLFGFSGGAQFAHRFALCHPRRVRSIFLAAAGHYTFPTPRLPFPFGMRLRRPFRALELDLDGLLSLPVTVVVGDQDRERDSALRVSPDLDRVQGRDRFERGRRWVMAANLTAATLRLPPPTRFRALPGADHRFETCVAGGMCDRLAEHLKRSATWTSERG